MSDKPPPPAIRNPAVVERASNLLGGLLADAFKRIQSDPDKPIKMKSFVFSTTTKNIRVVPGDDLPRYMLLPIEEYALYDDKLMSRIGDDIFELRLPVTNPSGAPSALALDPTLRVRVTPNADDSTLRIESIGASLFGLDADNARVEAPPSPPPPPAAAAAEADSANATRVLSRMEYGMRSADLSFNTSLAWRSIPKTARGELRTRLVTKVSATFVVALPPPFTVFPSLVVQGAAGVVMRSVADLVLPQFVNLLVKDYERWLNGTSREESIGSLMGAAEVEVDQLGESESGSEAE